MRRGFSQRRGKTALSKGRVPASIKGGNWATPPFAGGGREEKKHHRVLSEDIRKRLL